MSRILTLILIFALLPARFGAAVRAQAPVDPARLETPAGEDPAADAAGGKTASQVATPDTPWLPEGAAAEDPLFAGGSCRAECFEVYQICATECYCDDPWCGVPCFQRCSTERTICTGACSV